MIINQKLIKAIAECCESTGEFVSTIMALKGLSSEKVAKIKDCSEAYIAQIKTNKISISTKMCLELSEILEIDPYILNKVNADYKLKRILERRKMINES